MLCFGCEKWEVLKEDAECDKQARGSEDSLQWKFPSQSVHHRQSILRHKSEVLLF